MPDKTHPRPVPGVDVLGAVTPNGSVDGMDALAVEIAARSGARVVWLPAVEPGAPAP